MLSYVGMIPLMSFRAGTKKKQKYLNLVGKECLLSTIGNSERFTLLPSPGREMPPPLEEMTGMREIHPIT